MAKSARILVVDDEPLIAMMLQDWLAELGCEAVGPAHTAEAALVLVAGGAIDGAILDVTLGAGDCYPIAQALQRLGVPFVFATGHGANGIDPQFKGASTLLKPFNFDAVQGAVAELTKQASAGLTP